MANAPRFGLVSENAYFAKVDQMLLESLRETLELQEEARRCAEAGRTASGGQEPELVAPRVAASAQTHSEGW